MLEKCRHWLLFHLICAVFFVEFYNRQELLFCFSLLRIFLIFGFALEMLLKCTIYERIAVVFVCMGNIQPKYQNVWPVIQSGKPASLCEPARKKNLFFARKTSIISYICLFKWQITSTGAEKFHNKHEKSPAKVKQFEAIEVLLCTPHTCTQIY